MKNVVVAKVVVLNPEGKLLALRRSETDERRPLQWDIPGGWVDEGEDIAGAAARETDEEAGLQLKPENLTVVYATNAIKTPKDEPINITWIFFTAHTDQTEVTISDEHAEFAWMELSEALQEFEYPLHRELFQHIKDNQLLG